MVGALESETAVQVKATALAIQAEVDSLQCLSGIIREAIPIEFCTLVLIAATGQGEVTR